MFRESRSPVSQQRPPAFRASGVLDRRAATRLLLAAPLAVLAACQRVTELPFNVARIGLLAPLTGEHAASGREMAAAVRLAVEEWNGLGGVAGIHLELVDMDEAFPNAARILAEDRRMLLVTGASTTAAGTALLGQANPPAAVLLARYPALRAAAQGPVPPTPPALRGRKRA